MSLRDDLIFIIGAVPEADIVFFLLENPGLHTQIDISKNTNRSQPEVSLALNSLIAKGFIRPPVHPKPWKYEIPDKRWLKEQLRFYEFSRHSELLTFIENL
jgi:hypothetical protein